VIGEGANLGCTQAGRIAYALHGAAGRAQQHRFHRQFGRR
jgi:NAD-specific glutamate dehydrogenase